MIPRASSATVPPPALIVVGGFAGSGKTTVSRRLSHEFSIPRLGSDTIGRAIRGSKGIRTGDAQWIAYDVLFELCEEYLGCRVSHVLDLTMGWSFQWQRLDAIVLRCPQVCFLPVVLRCPREVCIERTRRRYASDPDHYDPPRVYSREPKNLAIWSFLGSLDRPDVHFVDANRSLAQVYDDVKGYITARIDGAPNPGAKRSLC